jgi:hypothetical protein
MVKARPDITWVERSDTHHLTALVHADGFRNSSTILRGSIRPDRSQRGYGEVGE